MKTFLAAVLAALLGVMALASYAAPATSGPDLQSPLPSDDDKDKEKDKDKKDG
jgi:hypothetical protein